MDEKLKLGLVIAGVVVAVGLAIFMGVRSFSGPQIEVVGTLEGVSKDAEMGKEDSVAGGMPADQGGSMPVVTDPGGR